jgi:hypothetical protein
MILDPIVSGLLAAMMVVAAMFQFITVRCVPTKELRATKMVMAGGFLILGLYFFDLIVPKYEFISVDIVCFGMVLVALGSIVGNRKEER